MQVTAIEEVVRTIWASELRVAVGPDDHFFRRGGNSLTAARVTINVGAALSMEVKLATLLNNPVARDYALAIAEQVGSVPAPRQQLPLVDRSGRIPLSFQQEARLERERDARTRGGQAGPYFIPIIVALDEYVTHDRAAAAVNRLVSRHESLHTGFTIGQSRSEHRAFVDEAVSAQIETVDIRELGQAGFGNMIEAVYAKLVGPELELDRPPLLRARLLHWNAQTSVLVLAAEHMVVDGWSKVILYDELAAALYGDPLPPLEAQYADWAAWHRELLSGQSLEDLLDFWRAQLAGTFPFPPLALPTPPTPCTGNRAQVAGTLPAVDHAMLEHRASSTGTTLFVVMLTAFARAWQRCTGAADVVIHGPTGNRTVPEARTMVGNFAHSLVYRLTSPASTTEDEAVEATQAVVAAALQHQDIPLSMLTMHLQPEVHGRATHPPRLFLAARAMGKQADIQNARGVRNVELRLPDASAEPGIAAFYGTDSADNLVVQLVFRQSEVDSQFVGDLLAEFMSELRALVGPQQ